MKTKSLFLYLLLVIPLYCIPQKGFEKQYTAAFTTLHLTDSTRLYKPNTSPTDSLHYRPIDVDVWYPSKVKGERRLVFGSLFGLYEKRAIGYQDDTDYSGLTNELAQFYVAELGFGTDGKKLLNIKTDSYWNLRPTSNKLPAILYMAGFNGMGFENFKVLESLAKHGYLVLSVSSIGRYPGDMTNTREDMLEQVYDAEFILKSFEQNEAYQIDTNKIGVLACSWGGMSAAVLLNRNPKIKAMVSFDGTETHYFGETDNNRYADGANSEDNDLAIKGIQDGGLLNPEGQTASYLYLESGDKLDDFEPTAEYNYYKRYDSTKYYLRFKNSGHSYFVCIPSILKASVNSVKIYQELERLTVGFFDETLRGQPAFKEDWSQAVALDYTTTRPYDTTKKKRASITNISGTVLEKKTDEPLPYVNIGILGREIGTVTDLNGIFSLPLQKEYENDTIRFSMVGYRPIELLVKDIAEKQGPLSFKMNEQVSELNEVIVSAKAFRKKTLGNKTESKFISTGFSYDQLGAEMGIKIKIRKKPTFVDAFNFNISYNRLSAKTIFRLNFYEIAKGKPTDNILTENILLEIEPKETGPISIDLRPYDIILTDDVIVTLEWVRSEGENKEGEGIFFPLGLLTNGTLYKKSSQAKFKKYSSLGVGFNIDVRI